MKNLTVTVAISAYNEGKNIKNFLESVLIQKEDGFKIEKVLVISDGSTDDTVNIAKQIKSLKIQIREYNTRLGKSSRLNEIYKSLNSDILVQSDSDVIFANKRVIKNLIQPLINNNSVGMCGGNPTPLNGETFTEKAINTTCEIYLNFRKTVRGGNNKFSADGRLLAYKKELVKKITVPTDMFANDLYTYFCCLTQEYKYRFVETAEVHFRSPQTLKDHIRQNSRFLASPIRMSRYFPKELVKKETKLPKFLLFKSMAKQFIKHPVLCSYIFMVNRYCQIKALVIEKQLDSKWDIAISTKELKNA